MPLEDVFAGVCLEKVPFKPNDTLNLKVEQSSPPLKPGKEVPADIGGGGGGGEGGGLRGGVRGGG